MTDTHREYETVFILDPTLEENREKEEVDRVTGWITDLGAHDIEAERWGRRRMAYEIRKKRDGIYNIIRYRAEGSVVKEFERRMRMNEAIIRVLTVLVDPRLKRAIAAAKAAAEAAAKLLEVAPGTSETADEGAAKPVAVQDSVEKSEAPAPATSESGS